MRATELHLFPISPDNNFADVSRDCYFGDNPPRAITLLLLV